MAKDLNLTVGLDNTEAKSKLQELEGAAGKFSGALKIAAGAFAAFGVANTVTDTINQFDDLAKSARLAGAAASDDAFKGFQVLQKAMGEAGVDAGTFERAMLQTTTRLKEGFEGGDAFAEIFDKLGDSVLTANGELADGATLMTSMIEALNAGTISTDEFAKVVGGRAGPVIQQQFASLNQGAGELQATLADMEQNSNIVSLDAANNAEKFNDTVGRMKEVMGTLLTEAVTPLLPVLNELANDVLAALPGIIESVKSGFDALQPVFSLIGTLLTEVVGPAFGLIFEALGNIAEAVTPLVEAAIPALKEAFDSVVGAAQAVVEWFQSVFQSLSDIYDKAVQFKNDVVGTFDDMTQGVSDSAKEMYENTTGWFAEMYDEVVGNSIVPDMVDAVIAEFIRQESTTTAIARDNAIGVTNEMTNMKVGVTREVRSMGSSFQKEFADVMTRSFEKGRIDVEGFRNVFKKSISNMITDAISGGQGIQGAFSNMFNSLGGIFSQGGSFLSGLFNKVVGSLGSLFGGGRSSGGGFFSDILGGIGDFFGGFFADGGSFNAGKPIIVGERGPEMIIPGRSGTVIPNEALNMGGGDNYNINFTIQAIDTSHAKDVILQNKGLIQGIVQNAHNSRGRRGPLG